MILIDTDVLIDHFHGHRAALDFIAQSLASGEPVVVSVVTIAELLSGMRSGEKAKTERLLALFDVLEVNEAVARQAGHYLRQFRRDPGIELGDALIAATARLSSARVVTRNEKHYPMSDVSVVVPYERGR